MSADTSSDELVSQFLAVTGSTDPSRATSYLEMSGGDLQVAVGLYMEHQAGGGLGGGGGFGGGGFGGGGMMDDFGGGIPSSIGDGPMSGGAAPPSPAAPPPGAEMDEDGVRAPDQTRTMRLMDDGSGGMPSHIPTALMGMAGGMGGAPDPDMFMSAFATASDMDMDGQRVYFDARRAANQAEAEKARKAKAKKEKKEKERALREAAERGDAAAKAALAKKEKKSSNLLDDDDDDFGDDYFGQDDDDDDDDDIEEDKSDDKARSKTLTDMFAPPLDLMHRAGGFQGARTAAKDAKRWLLVNLQRDSDFACHALNRDVWGNDLVENLVREGFIFWQAWDVSRDGQTYVQRYRVEDYPHVAILDPRTSRLMWKKEGWTQVDPLTAEMFAEIAADFCSRHSFDKPPVAMAPKGAASASTASGLAAKPSAGMPMQDLGEDEQLQAAISASMKKGGDDNDAMEADEVIEVDDDGDAATDGGIAGGDDDVGVMEEEEVTTSASAAEEKKPPSFEEKLLAMEVGDEPADGARVQIRMPDGKRLVRKFKLQDTVMVVFAFVAQSNEEAKTGKPFELKVGFPPRDLLPEVENSVEKSGLKGEAITVRWK